MDMIINILFRYQYRLQYELNGHNQFSPLDNTYDQSGCRRRPVVTQDQEETPQLSQLIFEENNFQRLQLERQSILNIILFPNTPASPEFIAKFRREQMTKRTLCDSKMDKQHIHCIICLEDIQLHQSYARWPCPSDIPHLFHEDCMLNALRMKNTCPLCRYPVQPSSVVGRNPFLNGFFTGF